MPIQIGMSFTPSAPHDWHLEATDVVARAPVESRIGRLLALVARCVGASRVRLIAPGTARPLVVASWAAEDCTLAPDIDLALVRRALDTGPLARDADGQPVENRDWRAGRAILLFAPVLLSGRAGAVLECRGDRLGERPDAAGAMAVLCAFVALALDAADRAPAVAVVAGGVAHDFNNHLTAINGLCEMVLEDERLHPALREDLTCIRSAGEQASVLTRQLLAYSGRQILEPHVTDLHHCVEHTLPAMRHLAGRDVRVAFVPVAGRVPVEIDPQQVAHVLLMLAENARDARASSIDLTTSIVCRADGSPVVRLAFTDDGRGMSEDLQARAFEPFFTTKRQLGHVGLGLPAASGLLKRFGGSIAIRSRDGAGTTVELSFPLRETAMHAASGARVVSADMVEQRTEHAGT